MERPFLIPVLSILCMSLISPVIADNLTERAINGQFDQVTITYEEWITNPELIGPPVPDGWTLTDAGEPTMYWEPDDWEEEESDLHGAIWLTHDGDQPGASTILDATGGQYVEIILGAAGNEEVGVYLDDILIGTASGRGAIERFNISGTEWTTSSELRFNAIGSQWTSSLVRSISLMANTNLEAPIANFTGNPTSGNRPLTVQFTDTSTNAPTSWEWDFDNDGTVDSYDQNPEYT